MPSRASVRMSTASACSRNSSTSVVRDGLMGELVFEAPQTQRREHQQPGNERDQQP